MSSSSSVGLFYGSSTCYTEFVGEKIVKALGEVRVDIYKLGESPLTLAQDYDYLILGIPTWDYGELQEDWENDWIQIDDLNLSGKKVALYGVGDQLGYPEWFLDAMGYLHDKVVNQGAEIVGHWPIEGYEFKASQALTPDKNFFVGLAIDEENQFDLTDQRISQWVSTLKDAFKI